MLKKITSSKILIIFAVFVTTHLLLLNINYAEWGDSYRILRASEFVRQGTYPQDEKRQPVFSILLALRPAGFDQVLWGRIEMFVFSIALFWLFYKILYQYDLSERARKTAMWLLVLNPVLLYWSIRIMADIPFALLALLTFYLYNKWKTSLTWKELLVLGTLVGVSVLTRFEGYILGFSLGLGIFLDEKWNLDSIKKGFLLVVGFLLVTLPWFFYRNPMTSTYFEEPGTRVYDLNMLYIYLVSLTFLFGFVSACFFFYKSLNEFKKFSLGNVALTVFVAIELILALVWPAAIPRLLTPIIPFLIIPLALYIDRYFERNEKASFADALALGGLLFVFLVSQYILKLQFLVLIRPLLFFVITLQIVNIFSILKRNFCIFEITLVLSMAAWTIATIWLHKDIFKAVVEANKYAQDNFMGTIVHNDISSVSDWYLNIKTENDQVEGIYVNMDSREGRTYQVLALEGADYVLMTNEHNTDMEFSADGVEYLEQIKEFRYTIRGKEFFTKILKFIEHE